MKDFELTTVPLSGWNLLEANAGTGKTYSICMLYLRLLLEQRLAHESIVVITFTRIATAELRSRIEQTLTAADAVMRGISSEPADSPIRMICEPLTADEVARANLKRARAAFDLAPIMTIHGYCQRLLGDFSLSTGFDPDLTLIENESLLLEPLVAETWSELSQGFCSDFAYWVQGRRRDWTRWLSGQVQRIVDKPDARLDGPDQSDHATVLAALDQKLAAYRAQLKPLWASDGAQIRDLLQNDPALNRSSYTSGRVAALLHALERFLTAKPLQTEDVEALQLITGTKVRAKTKAKKTPPEHEFFDRFEPCYQALQSKDQMYQTRANAITLELLPQVLARYQQHKSERGLLTYGDLVSRLVEALADKTGAGAMIDAVRGQYGAALIDEFQDTDLQQFQIFDTLFRHPLAAVWLVGDPKQALYGFRGADVFAYLKARHSADRSYRLTTDWRAQPALVACTNALFSGPADPFVVAGIDFAPATAAPRPPRVLVVEGKPAAAMRCYPLTGTTKGAAQSAAASACADEIAHLLQLAATQQAQIDDGVKPRTLEAADIAVLVRNRSQAALVARELNQRQLACVQPAVGDVFASEQASQLERLLHGVLFCDQPDRVAGAAATELVGAGARELAAARDEDDQAEHFARQFDRWRQVWEREGLGALLVAILSETGAAARILPQIRGRRSLSNWFQLSELLEYYRPSASHSGAEQLAWLSRRRQDADNTDPDALERLESQAGVVRIVTIHGAKGDQFGVTFCPFLWNDGIRKTGSGDFLECHDEGRLVLDFGSARLPARELLQLQEALSENVRLTYVALTRAICSSWIAWGGVEGTEFCGLSYLLEGQWPEPISGSGAVARREERREQQLNKLSAAGVECLATSQGQPIKMPAVSRFGHQRRPKRVLHPAWEVTSYSSLFGHQGGPRDADEATATESVPAEQTGTGIQRRPAEMDPALLPAGPQTGLMVHDLLDKLPSFDRSPDQLLIDASLALGRFGMSEVFAPALARIIDRALTVPLNPLGLRLAEVPPADQIREMEFHLAAKRIDADAIWELVRGVDRAPSAGAVSSGFLRGFIDLVVRFDGRYYVLDYKTNWLGDQPDDYAQSALEENVRYHQYDLQYHLYTVAVHQTLSLIMPDYNYSRHFGGVLYLYLRGLDDNGRGVHFCRPADRVVGALSELICR